MVASALGSANLKNGKMAKNTKDGKSGQKR